MRNKTFIFLFVMVFLIIAIIYSESISSFSGTTGNYTLESKADSITNQNASSLSFMSRFIGGINIIGKYVVNLFTGRFGILESGVKSLVINITSHLNSSQIARGNTAVTGEDDKGVVSNSVNFTARVFEGGTDVGFSPAICFFYVDSSFIGNSSTNSTGYCTVNYTKNTLSVGNHNLFVNYSITSFDNKIVAEYTVSFSIIQYITSLTMGNLRSNGKYYDGDNATLSISITKNNETGLSNYDPQNISANATNAAQTVYSAGSLFYPGLISRFGVGQYQANVTVNYSFGGFIRWDVLLSDNGFLSYIGSAVHADKAICSGDFSAFGGWSACSSGSQTRTRTDSSGCSEVEIQSCEGGGGGSGCTSIGFGQWSSWGSCVDRKESRIRTDNCGNKETEFRQCGCVAQWQCGVWGICTDENQIRTCNDINQCDENNLTYTQSQSCIRTLTIEYSPQELFLKLINNSIVDFSVNIKDSITEPLTVKWFYNSELQKQDSGVDKMISLYTNKFEKDGIIKAEVSNGLQTQNIEWAVTILSGNQTFECREDWYCKWTSCTNETEYRYTTECTDLNDCGTNIDRPYKQLCSCFADFKCGDWSQCSTDFDIKDVLKGNYNFTGEYHRVCVDINKCENSTEEIETCDLASPITVNQVEHCYEDYVEVREIKTNKLVSRLKGYSLQGMKKLDIGFISSDFVGYCSYCFDNVKNYDESGIDCGGQNCSVCIERERYFDWLYYVKIALWILFVLLLLNIIYNNRKKIRERVKTIKEIRLPKLKLEKILGAGKVEKVRIKFDIRYVIVLILKPIMKLNAREIIGKSLRKSVEYVEKKRIKRIERKIQKKEIRKQRKIVRIEKRIVRRKAREIKRRIRRKEIKKSEIVDLERQLREWKQKGYYNTVRLQKKLDEFKGKNPLED